jgi:hypothetical protein
VLQLIFPLSRCSEHACILEQHGTRGSKTTLPQLKHHQDGNGPVDPKRSRGGPPQKLPFLPALPLADKSSWDVNQSPSPTGPDGTGYRRVESGQRSAGGHRGKCDTDADRRPDPRRRWRRAVPGLVAPLWHRAGRQSARRQLCRRQLSRQPPKGDLPTKQHRRRNSWLAFFYKRERNYVEQLQIN